MMTSNIANIPEIIYYFYKYVVEYLLEPEILFDRAILWQVSTYLGSYSWLNVHIDHGRLTENVYNCLIPNYITLEELTYRILNRQIYSYQNLHYYIQKASSTVALQLIEELTCQYDTIKIYVETCGGIILVPFLKQRLELV